MQTRREFLQSAAALTGSAFAFGDLPEAIARAYEINPDAGTTFLDAEHIVILMQENRSFDHCYGALQGVRGFRDPRPFIQPNGRPIWYQTDAKGDTYAPFRLDLKGSNVTWIGGLPHSWPDQVDALNGGRSDKWLIAKKRGDLPPFALGFYTREDLSFYYSLADCFTVCDQAFCSSLTGTTPNRLYLWTGTVREDADHPARVQNSDTYYTSEASWKTFPERLEEAGVSWKIYQNELSVDTGLRGEADSWLANFTDNPIEHFTQFGVRFHPKRREYVAQQIEAIPVTLKGLADALASSSLKPEEREKMEKEAATLSSRLKAFEEEKKQYNDETWSRLPDSSKSIHNRAFTTNSDDPDYRELEALNYEDNGETKTVNVPKGDTLHQFRKDVESGELPAVSYLVAPENFSDHPSSAWFGAWYLSETLNILTKNPEVWKKTIFILCYDENDGWFDHVPPFLAPHPDRPETGKCSKGLDTRADVSDAHGRDSSIGLGYRCPLVVASPWSRGGCVNSQVFDHTSIIQLIEKWLDHRDIPVQESNISDWRRTVCGDMTSIFRPYHGEKYPLPEYLNRDETITEIHRARSKPKPSFGNPLTRQEVREHSVAEFQESGTRPSCPLPYELEANSRRNQDKLEVTFTAKETRFGAKAAGSPFNLISYKDGGFCRSYAVKPGTTVVDVIPVANDEYDFRIDGPNGFLREFQGTLSKTHLHVIAEESEGRLVIHVFNSGDEACEMRLVDKSYGRKPIHSVIEVDHSDIYGFDLLDSHGWYDFEIQEPGARHRFAGRIETGKWSRTDPAMG